MTRGECNLGSLGESPEPFYLSQVVVASLELLVLVL